MGQPGFDRLALLRAEDALDAPVLLGAEVLDLVLALADQPERHRLHPARRAAARKLAPQHRREGEADQVVEGAPGEVGIDQLAVEIARVGEGVLDGRLGDGVEDHPLDVDALQRLSPVEHLADVPGDGLTFPVRVGREIQVIGAAQRLGDVLDPRLGPGVDLPVHGEVGLGTNRSVLRRQVADVPVAGQHGEARTQVLVDGFCLRRGLDDDDVHRLGDFAKAIIAIRFPGRRSILPANSHSSKVVFTRGGDNWQLRISSSTVTGAAVSAAAMRSPASAWSPPSHPPPPRRPPHPHRPAPRSPPGPAPALAPAGSTR